MTSATRGAAVPRRGKTRITIYLDHEVIDAFRAKSERSGNGYQTLINEALLDSLAQRAKPLTAKAGCRIVREELARKA